MDLSEEVLNSFLEQCKHWYCHCGIDLALKGNTHDPIKCWEEYVST